MINIDFLYHHQWFLDFQNHRQFHNNHYRHYSWLRGWQVTPTPLEREKAKKIIILYSKNLKDPETSANKWSKARNFLRHGQTGSEAHHSSVITHHPLRSASYSYNGELRNIVFWARSCPLSSFRYLQYKQYLFFFLYYYKSVSTLMCLYAPKQVVSDPIFFLLSKLVI